MVQICLQWLFSNDFENAGYQLEKLGNKAKGEKAGNQHFLFLLCCLGFLRGMETIMSKILVTDIDIPGKPGQMH